ncbi:MAG TPA: hypothetical protein PLX15_04280 [Candidatus Woesearchaeota archaeon]|nr:hypothetical protein [Candidatus Woesearchaeota archaeon]
MQKSYNPNRFGAGQAINLGFDRVSFGERGTKKPNGFFKKILKWVSTIGITGAMAWNLIGFGNNKDVSYLQQNSFPPYATQVNDTSVANGLENIFNNPANPENFSDVGRINPASDFNKLSMITPCATELVDNDTVKDTLISSDATECDLESRISMYPYPINQDFIDSISNIDSDSKIIELYADIVKQFPRAYSAVFDTAKENGINPALCAAFLTLEGGLQIAYNKGESDSEVEQKVKNGLGYDIRGVWQITYDTWKQYGEGFTWDDMYRYGPSTVVFSRVIKDYMEIVGNDFIAGILAYNMGPYGVKKLIKEELDGDSSKLLDFLYEVSQYKDGYNGRSQRYWIEKADYPRTILELAIHFQELLDKAGVNVPNALFSDKNNWRYLGSVLTSGRFDTSNPKVSGNGILYHIHIVRPGDSLYKIQKTTGSDELLINGEKYDPKTYYKMIQPGDVILCLKN